MRKLWIEIVTALWALAATQVYAAISYNQTVSPWHGTNTSNASASFAPTAGDYLLPVGVDYNTYGNYTITFSGAGTYSAYTSFSDNNGDSWALGYNTSASSSSQTATVVSTGAGADVVIGWLIDYSGVGSISSHNYQLNSSPGTGTGAIVGTAVSVPSGDILIALCIDVTGATVPTTTGTSRGSGTTGGTYNLGYIWGEYSGSGGSITPAFTSAGGATDNFVVVQYVLAPSGGSCTHEGYSSSGALSTPNGSSGSYVGNAGAFVTPNCSSTEYWQPTVGNFGAN